MKKLLAIIFFVPSVALANGSHFETGNTLLAKIDSTSMVEKMVALGYIKGIADAHSGTNICAPLSATAGQLNDMVAQFLRAYPENRSYTGGSLVLYVLSNAWPCGKMM